MEIITAARAMHAYADRARAGGQRLALVPTMGALHDGHLALVRTAQQHADQVVVSIFVNPTQFGPAEDLAAYPRSLPADVARLQALGGTVAVFAPSVQAMYPYGPEQVRAWVHLEGMDQYLCGRYRPGHFQGVTTVVSKLFNLCKPHTAVFGLKDAQQYLILRRMVRELHFDVEMIGVPTVREADGLAMSSRNVYLTTQERPQAVVLSQAVAAVRALVAGGERQGDALVEAMYRILGEAPDAHIQYAEVVDTETIQPVRTLHPGQEILAAVAVILGKTRLIDNTFARVPGAAPAEA